MATTAAQIRNVLPCFPVKDLSTFHVESFLGSGGFSHVVLARDACGSDWALKLIPAPNAKSLDDVDTAPLLLSEARIHLLLSEEPSVLPCLETFKSVYVDSRDPSHATYMAVLRMPVAACSVEEWLFSANPAPRSCQAAPRSQVDEADVLSVWIQMVNAVHRCHAHGIVHKDIKLPNFLMDNRGKVQIMDFGLAQVEGVTPRTVAGTPWTMSPAGLKHVDDGRAGDWWALGVVLYQLLQSGAWPFKHCWWPWQKGGGERMEAAIRRAVLAGRITFTSGARVTEPTKALIRGLLQADPHRRWQLRQVLACEAVKPELLSNLTERFPELALDMQTLLQLQHRAREVQALSSEGGNAHAAAVASLASAGSAIAAAASSVVNRARGVSALVGEGALHWHWGPGGGRCEPEAGEGGGSYRPLLDGEDREESEPDARFSSQSARFPSTAPPRRGSASAVVAHTGNHLQTAPSLPSMAPPQVHHTHVQSQSWKPHPQVAGGRQTSDLLLLFSDEMPDAHPSPAGPHNAAEAPLPQQAGRVVAPPSNPSPFYAVHANGASKVVQVLSPGSSAAAATVPAGFRHANTSSNDGNVPLEAYTTGLTIETEGKQDGAAANFRHHSPCLSRRSMSGPQMSPGRGSSPTAPISSATLGSRRFERTSLHDLFGIHSGTHPFQSVPFQQERALSGGGLGGVVSSCADVHGSYQASWPVTRTSPPCQRDLGSDACSNRTTSEPMLLPPPPSSWVPPPPEAFAATATAAAVRVVGLGAGAARTGIVNNHSGETLAGASYSARSRDGGDGLESYALARAHHHRGFLAMARKLFSNCLQRPSVKYDIYDYDKLETLAVPNEVS